MAESQLAENQIPSEEPQQDPKQDLSSAMWVAELTAAQKNQEKWVEQGRKIVLRYLDKRSQDTENAAKINLFTSNTQILLSTLYARFPKPLVTREFEDQDDDVARVASIMVERMLKIRPRDDFDSAMKAVVQDRLVPGAGTMWFRYDPKIEQGVMPAETDPVTGQVISPEQPYEKIVDERAACDYVFWEDIFWSPARVWEQVRWVARRVKMSKLDISKRFGDVVAGRLRFSKDVMSGVDHNRPEGEGPARDDVQYTDVYEVWCKRSKKVYWVSMDQPVLLDMKYDPLGLDKFFPTPKFLMSLSSTSNMMPRADYLLAQDQYEELDSINGRITALERAIRVVGICDGTNPELERIFQDGMDNKIIPSLSYSQFAERGGFKGSIDWLPLEPIVNALERLRTYRQDLISQIYEVTGISDIMRGSTKASETLGAQQLKAQYGSVKLQYLQMEVATFVEEALEIKAQIIRKHFQPETIVRETNMEFSLDKQYAQGAIQLIKSPLFDLRVEVHADSMAVPEFTAEREGRMAFIRAIGEMMSNAAPLIEKSPQAGVTMLRVMQWAAASFRTGNTIEGVIDNAIRDVEKDIKRKAETPPAPPPRTEVAKAKRDESQAVLNIAKAHEAGANAVIGLTDPIEAQEQDPPTTH